MVIGNDVWIGFGAIIIAGVSVGNGAVISAGAVVTKDVAPYSIVGRTPAKLIYMRFDEEQVTHWLKTKRWGQSPDWMKENADSFQEIQRI